MNTIDSNDPQKETLSPEELSLAKQKARAQKEHDKKNEANNNLFIDICYHVFINKLNLHYHALQLMEQHQKMAIEIEKEKYRAISEDEYARSIENYNKAFKERETDPNAKIQDELGKRLGELIERLLAEIAKLKEHVKFLDNEIVRVNKDLSDIKKSLAEEIKKIFLDENFAVGFTSRPSLLLALPDDYRHKPGAERFQGVINMDKLLYQQFANLMAERLNDKMRFQDLQLESHEAARDLMRSEITKLISVSPFIPEQEKEKVVAQMMGQPKVTQEIEALHNKLCVALAKNPATTALIDAGCQKERELQEIYSQKDAALERLKTLESLKNNCTALASQQSDGKLISAATVAALETAVHQATSATAAPAAANPIEPTLAVVERCTERLDEIKDKAKSEFTEARAPATPERHTELKKEIMQTLDAGEAALQNGLADLLKSYGVVADDNSDEFKHHQGPSAR